MASIADHINDALSGSGSINDRLHDFWASTPNQELDYAEMTADFVTTATALADVTGLSITFTAPNKPVMLECWVNVRNSVVDKFVWVAITDSADAVQVQAVPQISKAAGDATPVVLKRRLSTLTAGQEYTFKVRGAAETAGNTTTFEANNSQRAFLRAYTVN